MQVKISENVQYVGVDDVTIDLFENQYLVPEGISYNSYLILDEKIALMDTVDRRGKDAWEASLKETLQDREVDYLVISHMEPDHAACIADVVDKFPEITLVGNAKTFVFMDQFDEEGKLQQVKRLEVKEGDSLSLGTHTLQFYMAPMVHWPEVMVTYETSEKILFSADGFGKFGALSKTVDGDWACEARRYYFNIVGKYGAPVQALLKKAATLEIEKILPLHGPILTGNLSYYLDLYQTWSSYEPENKGVLIAYASLHGNTAKAAETLGEMLREKGEEKVVVSDLARADLAEVIEDAFRYDRMILCAASYDGGVVPCMQDFLHHLQMKGYQKRTVGLVENGTWAPSAGRTMKAMLENMKDVKVVEPMLTIRSVMKARDKDTMEQLANALLNK